MTPVSRLRGLGAAALGLLAIWLLLNAGYIWFPRSDAPARADVVIVIGGGNEAARVERGVSLVERGYAPLLFTDDNEIRRHGCHSPVPTRCFAPDPDTTRGEARVVAASAAALGWRDVVLVLSRDQATRARIRFRRCYHLGLRVVTVPIGGSALFAAAYQDAAMVKAEIWQRGC